MRWRQVDCLPPPFDRGMIYDIMNNINTDTHQQQAIFSTKIYLFVFCSSFFFLFN